MRKLIYFLVLFLPVICAAQVPYVTSKNGKGTNTFFAGSLDASIATSAKFPTGTSVTNPAPAGSSAIFHISGNTGNGGFDDYFVSDPSSFSLNLGGGRFFRVPGGGVVGNLTGNGQFVTNVPPTSSTYHRYDLVKDFGATNDGFCFNNITIANGSANLQATSFSPGESGHTSFTFGDSIVGKVICIFAAGGVNGGTGGTNVCFTTTVQSVTDGQHLVLAAPVVTGGTGLTVGGVIGSDNTLAIQAALNTVSNGFSEVVVPPGIYVINGPLAWTNRSQLRVPPIIPGLNVSGAPNNTLKLTGQVPGFIAQASIGNQPPLRTVGSVFWSTATNLDYGSVIDAQNYTNSVFNNNPGIGGTNTVFANCVNVIMDGINWRACWNNNGKLLAMHGAGTFQLRNSRIDTGYTLYNVPTNFFLPSSVYRNEGSWGLTVPAPSSSGPSVLDNVEICGFYHGVNVGEHVYARNIQIESCMLGLDASTYPAGGGHRGWWMIDFEACKTNIYNEGGYQCGIQVNCTSESPNNNDWSFPNCLYSDQGGSGGGLLGTVWYENTSSTSPLPQYGGVNLNVIQDPNAGGGQTTNKFINTTNLYAFQALIGTTANDTPLTVRSLTTSIDLANTFQNEIRMWGNNLTTYWLAGVSGSPMGNAGVKDFFIGSFKDVITDGGKVALVLHNDTDILDCRSNIIAGGYVASTNGGFMYASSAGVCPINTNFTSYASGTAYTFVGTGSQQPAFGTTSPGFTIQNAGTYTISGAVGVKYSGATYAGAQTITIKFRRTNNTAADLTSGSRVVELPVLTTFTGGDVMTIPAVIYTASVGDIIQIFVQVSALPSAGSVLIDSAEMMAVRLF